MESRGSSRPWIYPKQQAPSWHLDYNQGLSPHASASFKTGNFKARIGPDLNKHVTTYIANDPRETRSRPLRVDDVKKMMTAHASAMRRSASAGAISGGSASRTPSRTRQFHANAKCNVSMRITEPEHEKPGGGAYNVWLCPGSAQPAQPWKSRARDTSVATQIKSTGCLSRPWSAP